MHKSYIFMQASLKMNAVLNCYETEIARGRDVSIVLPYCMRETMFFFEKIHLNARVFVLEELTGKHWLLYSFFYKRQIKKFLDQIGIDNNTHFFFTDVNDFRVGFLLPFLKECNPTQILVKQDLIAGPNYQIEFKSKNIKRILYTKLLSFFYNTHFFAANEYGGEFMWTDCKAYHLPVIDYSDTSIINKYKIKITDSSDGIIFYTSPYLSELYSKEEFYKINKDIIDILHQKGYMVFVKNHPLSGGVGIIDDLADEIIPSFIPGEYLDLSSFNFAIGFLSTAIATAAEIIPSYSVLNVGRVKDTKLRDSYVEYLEDYNPNVIFLNSLEEIPSFV